MFKLCCLLVVYFVLLYYFCVTNVLQKKNRNIMTAEKAIYLDELRPKKNGKCSVKIRITFNRKRKYFSTGIELNKSEFDQVINGKRRTPEQKDTFLKLNVFYTKALDIIKNLKVFTFDAF